MTDKITNKVKVSSTKSTLTITDSKVIKEKYGDGFSTKINGVEYRYSSSELSAQEIMNKFSIIFRKYGPGSALKWLKSHTVCYYGGKDKRTRTADQKASIAAAVKAKEAAKRAKAAPAETAPKSTGNPEFDIQLKRIEKFADTVVKELNRDSAWSFKYIEESSEMSEYKMPLPGLMLYTINNTLDKGTLNSVPAVVKFNKSKTLKRYRDWFSTTVDGQTVKAIIYIDAQASRSRGIKGLKEFMDLNLADIKLGTKVLMYEDIYSITESSGNLIKLSNANESFFARVPNSSELVLYEGEPYLLESINGETATIYDEENSIRARLQDVSFF